MAIDQPERDTNRPYPPASNVIGVLHRLRSRNLPERIDNDYLRDAGIPEGSMHRAAFALRFLSLVRDDAPTPALRSIATSTDEEYRDILAGLVRDAYREVFEVLDPAQDSPDRITNFFRRYTPASQRERMVLFFLGMCREAGIPTMEAPRQRATNGAPASKSRAPKPTTKPSGARRHPSPEPENRHDPGIGRSTGVPPALELLIRSLPPEGTPMSAARREQWLTMAEATLAFVYPAPASREPDSSNGEEEDIE
jgi:hypothetical protein